MLNKVLNIGFDAKRAFFNKSGLGNYSRNVLASLNNYYKENNYVLYTPKKAKSKNSGFVSQGNKVIYPEHRNKILQSNWRNREVYKEIKANNLDIFHGLSNELPFTINKTSVKKIVTIHDLIFIRYPNWYKLIDRTIYNKKFKFSSEVADTIIAISEQTKQDIIEFYNIADNKIEVVYQSCNDIFKIAKTEVEISTVKAKYNLPNNYLLNVGTIESRKNALSIVKAINENNIDYPLVIVGRRTKYTSEIDNYISKNNLKSKVQIINNVETEDLPAIYQAASVFIYPSVFEGFGIPIIEALYSKTPVITTKIGCFTEAGGKNSLYINPNNTNEIAESINKLISNTEFSKTVASKGHEFVQKFSNKKLADDLMKVYKM